MTLYAQNNLCAVSVSPEAHGGCGTTHRRPVEAGAPVKLWALTCEAGCENHLRHDPQWSTTIAELPEAYDEKIRREDFEKRGALDERKLMAMALAKMTGIDIPDTIVGAITGMMPHIEGVLECPNGHGNAAGKKFCGDCGSPMSGPVPKAALDGPQQPAQPPPAPPSPEAGTKLRRLRDARLEELQALAEVNGVDTSGKRPALIARLAAAGVTSADLARLPVAA